MSLMLCRSRAWVVTVSPHSVWIFSFTLCEHGPGSPQAELLILTLPHCNSCDGDSHAQPLSGCVLLTQSLWQRLRQRKDGSTVLGSLG